MKMSNAARYSASVEALAALAVLPQDLSEDGVSSRASEQRYEATHLCIRNEMTVRADLMAESSAGASRSRSGAESAHASCPSPSSSVSKSIASSSPSCMSTSTSLLLPYCAMRTLTCCRRSGEQV